MASQVNSAKNQGSTLLPSSHKSESSAEGNMLNMIIKDHI